MPPTLSDVLGYTSILSWLFAQFPYAFQTPLPITLLMSGS
jgi:hypothetical protein